MKYIFINLKRFDVPRSLGGLCPEENSKDWIHQVLDLTVDLGLGKRKDIYLTYLLPESLLFAAKEKIHLLAKNDVVNLSVGCQGVHWKDVKPGKNFGAFTTSFPAAAAKSIGVDWLIIGHSEERRAKQEVMESYDPDILNNDELKFKATRAIDTLINLEVHAALSQQIKVLFCLGETAEERGTGSFEEQQPRIENVLRSRLLGGLAGITEYDLEDRLVIGYEPVWAIGPGRIPPGKEYISFVSSFIMQTVKEEFGFTPLVVYGGGLKKENAEMIASIDTLDGGLIALTRFSGEVGFDVWQLKEILDTYTGESEQKNSFRVSTALPQS